ncbi:MAG: hypothetical protein HY308_02090 [Gammaproteobacteria bacterium]|nr:hypothetical protein [Gammaproteobacteria bacterium]
MNKRELSLLLDLLRQPTAPFREQRVIDFVSAALRAGSVPFFIDPIGNIVVGCSSRKEYAQRVRMHTREPLRLYVAHMDHPGFHGVRWRGPDRLHVDWHGGAPLRHLAGAPVWVADNGGGVHSGKMQSARLTASGRTIQTAEIKLTLAKPRARAETLYGGFGFRAPVWQRGRTLYTKAADDLVGVYAIVATALDLYRKRKRAPFIGLLTRAEEVGFIGAIGHFELGWLRPAKRPVICISLETSRTLPGAVIGKGPVVRLGDRRTVFEPNALNVLTQLAQRLLPGRHQRRIMDGGTCEATAATVYGLTAIGLSVPLGNYHNQSFQGGPDSRGADGPAPEFVNLDDVEGMLTLCRGLLRPGLGWNAAWKVEQRAYQRRLRDSQRLLKSS